MRSKKGMLNLILAALVTVALLLPGVLPAAEFDIADCRYNFGLRLAYGVSTKTPSIHFYSLLPRWGLFLIHPHDSTLPGRLGISFEVEGIVSIADACNTGWELGATPLLKFTLPVNRGLHLFLEGGAGIITQQFSNPRVPHAFNFTPQVGAGVDIALASRLGLTVAYRFRHSSNAGIYKENPGLNTNFFHAGVTYFY
jgi:hypothetical protein